MQNGHIASVNNWLDKRTGIVNRMKATLFRLGIRGFNPRLRNAT